MDHHPPKVVTQVVVTYEDGSKSTYNGEGWCRVTTSQEEKERGTDKWRPTRNVTASMRLADPKSVVKPDAPVLPEGVEPPESLGG